MNGPDIPPDLPPDPPPRPPPRQPEDTYSPRVVLLALVFVLALVLGGLYLVHVLRDSSHLEDCLMQGRTNCYPVDTTPASR